MKCIHEHPVGECTLDESAGEPQCVNCNGYHTANNYNKCEYFKTKIQPIINRRNSTTTNQKGGTQKGPAPAISTVTANKTFADALKSSNKSGKSANTANQNSAGKTAGSAKQSTNTTNGSDNDLEFKQILLKMLQNQEIMMKTLIRGQK